MNTPPASSRTPADQAKLRGADIIAAIRQAGIEFVISVPDIVTSEGLLRPIAGDASLRLIRVCKEDEGVSICAALSFCERRALLLSGGQQKLVALARALAVGTRLLLLDEPFEGVARALSQRLSEVIFGLRGKDLTVLIAQSELNHAASMLDQEVVIERGANAGEARP